MLNRTNKSPDPRIVQGYREALNGFLNNRAANTVARARARWYNIAERPKARPPQVRISDQDESVGEILIYEDILFEPLSDLGMTAKRFREEVEALGDVRIINVRINSGGGDVFDAFAIYNALVNHPARIEVDIEGLAASSASFIAQAGDERRAGEATSVMIHNAAAFVFATGDELIEIGGVLKKHDDQIAGIYARRSDRDKRRFRDLMDATTWFTASEARDAGLIDSITPNKAPRDVKPDNQRRRATRSSNTRTVSDVETRLRVLEIDDRECAHIDDVLYGHLI